MKDIVKQRQAILTLLYQARIEETKHRKAYLPISDVTDAIGDCAFNLSVLEELNHIKCEGYKVRITGEGVLASESAND